MEEVRKEEQNKEATVEKRFLILAGLFFCVIAGGIAVYFLFAGFSHVRDFFKQVVGILFPIFLGIAIAYVLNPIVNFWERGILRLAKRYKLRWLQRPARLISALVTILIMIGLLVAAGALLLPQIVDSVMSLARSIPRYVDQISSWISSVSSENNSLVLSMENALQNLSDTLVQWMRTDMLTALQESLAYVTNGVFGIASTIVNCMVGLIVSIYVLCSKEIFVGEAKKLVYAVFGKKQAHVILTTARKSHEIFGGFISGKLVDSLIIGLIALAVLTMLKMPYAVLVAVIVGITNIIPFFGPYIGAVPSALLIFLASPKQCVVFVIFIIILQQIDGNILGPKILGESTGLSAFWVVFSILLFGGLFGMIGMLVGVPTFAVIYYIIKTVAESVLKKKRLPIPSEEYQQVDYIDEESSVIYYLTSQDKGEVKRKEEQREGKTSQAGKSVRRLRKKERK